MTFVFVTRPLVRVIRGYCVLVQREQRIIILSSDVMHTRTRYVSGMLYSDYSGLMRPVLMTPASKKPREPEYINPP